jgi:hypothetical protein
MDDWMAKADRHAAEVSRLVELARAHHQLLEHQNDLWACPSYACIQMRQKALDTSAQMVRELMERTI